VNEDRPTLDYQPASPRVDGRRRGLEQVDRLLTIVAILVFLLSLMAVVALFVLDARR
jgi:hypothetical protein